MRVRHVLATTGHFQVKAVSGAASLVLSAPVALTRSHVCLLLLQVAVLANHQNGRDTHIRQIMLFGPPVQQQTARDVGPTLDTLAFSSFSAIR